jgi:hypothetical protein
MKKNNSNQKKEELKTSNPSANQKDKKDKKDKKNITPGKIAEKKEEKSPKKSSALLAASKGRSAVDQVKARAGVDVRGSSGLTNTGPFVSYDNEG